MVFAEEAGGVNNSASPREKRLIFILGRNRSGTTLLNRVLSSHPAIGFLNNEFNSLFWFRQNQFRYDRFGREKYWRMANDFFRFHELSPRKAEVFKKAFLGVDNFRDWYMALLECNCPGKELAGVKTVGHIGKNAEMIKTEFSDAYCLHIIRDPRDVFLSERKRFFGRNSPYYCSRFWLEGISEIQDLGQCIDHYLEIRYERLVSEPERELRRICDWLGLDFSDSMMKFYERTDEKLPSELPLLRHDFVRDNFNKWKKELRPDELEQIYAACAGKMRELGYLDGEENYQIGLCRHVRDYACEKIRFVFSMILRGKIFKLRNRRFGIISLFRIYFSR